MNIESTFIDLMIKSKNESKERTIINKNPEEKRVFIYGDPEYLKYKAEYLKYKEIDCYLTNEEYNDLKESLDGISDNNDSLNYIILNCAYSNRKLTEHCMNLFYFIKKNNINIDDLIKSKECADIILDFLIYIDSEHDTNLLDLRDFINEKWYPEIEN